MGQEVLITYATKYGATAEIAEKIGAVLRDEGLAVDVQPVDHVANLAAYRAVILGSAVYIGRWRKEAVHFLEDNEEVLAGQMVWLFSSGPTGEGDPAELLDGWHYPENLQPVVKRIDPHEIALFHGDLDAQKLNMLEKWMLKNVKAPIGDYRDWEAITSWALTIAAALKESSLVAGSI